MQTPTRPIVLTEADGYAHILNFFQADGVTAYPVNDRTFKGEIRTRPGGTLLAAFTFDTTNAASGVVIATLAGSLTTGKTLIEYWYSINWKIGAADPDTFMKGPLTIEQRITQ